MANEPSDRRLQEIEMMLTALSVRMGGIDNVLDRLIIEFEDMKGSVPEHELDKMQELIDRLGEIRNG